METEDGWVTGPALETVKALKAIRVGDQVRLDPELAKDLNIPELEAAETQTIVDIDQWSYISGWRFLDEQIVAWRPKKP